jgi:GH25 family lysozyme M1 (1,4-beta-N-acetylmuramidase)
MLLLSGCGAAPQPADPYAGMVQVESGYGTKMWVKEYPEVPVNPLRNWDGTAADGITDENGVRYTVRDGVDVSEHQGEIDWTKLAADGVDFAILRAGYRGYGAAGRLMEDAFFKQNIAGALENGVDVGVYFFSQATSAEEAEEEADFLLALLRSYRRSGSPCRSFSTGIHRAGGGAHGRRRQRAHDGLRARFLRADPRRRL